MKRVLNGDMKRLSAGVGMAAAIYLALLALYALLVVNGSLGEERAVLCTWLGAMAAAFSGAVIATAGQAKPLIPSALYVTGFLCVTFLLGYLLNGSLSMMKAAYLLLPVLSGTAAALFLRGGGRKKRKRSRR